MIERLVSPFLRTPPEGAFSALSRDSKESRTWCSPKRSAAWSSARGRIARKAEEGALAVLATCERESVSANGATTHRVSVFYDGEDLDAVAAAVGLDRNAVIALHAEREYRVAMLGFLPGFAYLHGLDERLRLPRRAPRPRVPAGSVAIAAQYTGIYPFASAGGWNLLGRAVASKRLTRTAQPCGWETRCVSSHR